MIFTRNIVEKCFMEVKKLNGTSILQWSIDSKFISISVMNNKSNLDHAHKDIELIYLIKGQLQVNVNNKIMQMQSSDFVLINSNDFHSFKSEKDNLFVVITFNYFQLSSLLEQKNLSFSCNSVEHVSAADQELRYNIDELLTAYMKKHNLSQIQFLEKALKLILTLTLNFLNNRDESGINRTLSGKGQNKRLAEIIEYIQSNYREPLTLEEVAGLHYITVPYLSKFFKKQTGKTFSHYLNEIRLAHAVNELVNSNKPITRIALDNGFPNLAAFNRVFKENYNLKPLEYRKKNAIETYQEEDLLTEVNAQKKNEVLSELSYYLKNTVNTKNNIFPDTTEKVVSQVVKIGKMDAYEKYWYKLINLGYAKDILNSDMQEQITLLQNEIGFMYARFWGLFSDDMYVEDRSGEIVTYNFLNTNKILDFLIKNKLKPFIELGPKPKIISKTVSESLTIQKSSDKSLEEWKNLIIAFLLHCVERYGIEEVENWYFEIWNQYMDPIYCEGNFEDNFKKNKQHDPCQFKEYFKEFSTLKMGIKEIVPLAKVGGCGTILEGEKLDLFLKQWKLEKVQPDFFSAYLYPVEMDSERNKFAKKNMLSANPDYVRNKLNHLRKSLKNAGFGDLELNVTEWNISNSNREFLNDSLFKATYLVKNIVENLNENQINMLGYWLFSDIFSDFRDAKNLLHGGAGLVTKSGIKKPSYHAYALLNHLGDLLVAKSDHFIVTKKSGDRYQVLCFNYKHFNYSFYFHSEGSIGIHEQYDIFENNEYLNLTLKIQGISNGNYRIKELKLNRNYGSVLDKWLEFGVADDMKQDEVNYLKQICVPHIKVEQSLVKDHSIVLKGELQPHEVRLFELNLLIGES